MTEIGFLLDAGAVAFTDARAIADARVFERCLTYAAGLGALVIGHPQEPRLSDGACMTTGQFAAQLGLPGVSPIAERIGLERDLALVEAAASATTPTRSRPPSPCRRWPAPGRPASRHRRRLDPPPHAQRVRRRRLSHLLQAHPAAALRGRPHRAGRGAGRGPDRHRRLVPHAAGRGGEAPSLRGGRERRRRARDPAARRDAALPWRPPDLPALWRALALNPARLLGLDAGRLAPGAPADLVLFDPDTPFVLDRATLRSKSKNTPYDLRRMQGRVLATWVGGERVFSLEPA